MRSTILLILALVGGSAWAESGWKDEKGNRVPDTDSQKSVSGFAAVVLVTSDEDWEEKWNTPREVAPHFSSAETVQRGGKLFILTFFAGPRLGADDHAKIAMDIDVRRPDGSTSVHADGAECFEGKILGPREDTYLCKQVIEFVAEPTDLAGTWTVRINVIDTIGRITIPVSTEFTLE